MDQAELVYSGAAAQAAMIARREVSARELVEACVSRIGAYDTRLNAFKEVYVEQALAAAEEADRRVVAHDHSPLLGVPVAVKDDLDIAGRVTGWGTSAVTRPAVADSAVIRLLREAGAIIIGKTHLPELAIYGFTESRSYGITRNPWDVRRTAGGSSGGSAAAVAAGMVGIASGSDGGGSIRIPAACCGLFGFKASPGRTAGSGGWGGLSVQGAEARTVADSAWYVDLIAAPGAEPLTPCVSTDPRRLVVGVSTKPIRAGLPGKVDPEVIAAVRATARTLKELGHEVRDIDLPQDRAAQQFSLRYLRAVHDSIRLVDEPRRLERRTRQIVASGGRVPARAARRAREAGESSTGKLAEALDGVDLLLTPVINRPPVEVGRWARASGMRTVMGMSRVYGFTPLWNHTGRPAASVPAGLNGDGLPLAVQLVGRRGRDADVVAVSAQLERARPWAHLRPKL